MGAASVLMMGNYPHQPFTRGVKQAFGDSQSDGISIKKTHRGILIIREAGTSPKSLEGRKWPYQSLGRNPCRRLDS